LNPEIQAIAPVPPREPRFGRPARASDAARRPAPAALALLACLTAALSDAHAGPPAADDDFGALLDQADRPGGVPVIVEVDVAAQPEGRLPGTAAIAAQRNAIRASQDRVIDRVRVHRVRSLKKFDFLPYVAMAVDRAALEALGRDPEVAAVFEDRLAAPSLASSTAVIGVPGAIGQGFTGAGQVVAVLDTGVDRNHPFLAGRVVHEACYSSTVPAHGSTTLCPNAQESQVGAGAAAPCAGECAHGTHVAGIAAGNGATFSGVARSAGIMGVQVFSLFNGAAECAPGAPPCVLSYTSDQILGLEHVYAQRASFDIAAVNMSLGGGRFSAACDGDPTKSAIDLLRAAGIATIVASGNEGFTDAISAPACISSAISVGGTTDADQVAGFSNSAQILSLLAPGVSIDSSVPGNGFANFNGTSMATPHVAGAFAVIRSKAPAASVDAILSALQSTGARVLDARNGIEKSRIRLDLALGAFGGAPGTGALSVAPSDGLLASGPAGGPFVPPSRNYTLSNPGAAPIDFAVNENVAWLNAAPASGTLAPGANQNVTVSIDAGASALAPGTFATSVGFENVTTGTGSTSRAASLTMTPPTIANDKFADATVLVQSSGSTTASNVGATRETGEPNHAGNTGGHSLWWRWTAPSSGAVTIDTFGSNFNTLLAAYTGSSLLALAAVASNDDAEGLLQSRITFEVDAGATYRIAVDGYGGASGQILLNWNFLPDVAAPLPLTVTPEDGYFPSGIAGGPFSPGAKTYTLTNFNTVAQAFDVEVPSWLTASPASGNLSASGSVGIELAINAPAANALAPGLYTDVVQFNTIVREVRLTVASASQNNNAFADAALLSGPPGSASATNVSATKEGGEPNHGGNPGGRSLWWRWVAPSGAAVAIDTFGSDFDTTLGVYTGAAVASLATIASNDDAGGGLQSRVTFTPVQGTTYYIAVDGYNGASGTIALHLAAAGAGVPVNDDFVDAAVLSGLPQTAFGSNVNASTEPGEPVHPENVGGASVWWVWSAPITGQITIRTGSLDLEELPSDFDTLLAVYTGTQVANLALVAANDDYFPFGDLTSQVTFQAVQGTTYYIAVDGFEGDFGNIALNVEPVGAVNFNLLVAVQGSGSVQSTPAGVSCPGDCTQSYVAGTDVGLEAAPGGGSSFDGWSGACTGTGACMVDMTLNRSVTARFTAFPQLTVVKSGTGSGTVSSAPGGIDCGGDCVNVYGSGSVVTLTATASPGSRFLGWTGPCTGIGQCVINFGPTTSVTALFEPAAATVLLVDDDDNTPDVRGHYTAALQALGVDYAVWDTHNSDTEPAAPALSPFPAVVWFTGGEFGGAAGPGAAGEAALASYLDGGGCAAVVSQDYLFDRGLTAFMSQYLGAGGATANDTGTTTATGAGPFAGLGPYALAFPFDDFSDRIAPAAGAATAFHGSPGSIAVYKTTTTWRTSYWGFPFEAIPAAVDRAAAMLKILQHCSPRDSDGDGLPDAFDPDYSNRNALPAILFLLLE
jgi:subtilisin family serine protease